MTAPKRRLLRAIGGIAVSLFTTALLLLVGELIARRIPSPQVFMIPTDSNCLQRSALLGLDFVPNCAATWNDRLLSGAEVTTFHTNSLGLRDDEIADDGALRILAVGDSCTWGWQVAQDDAYPQVLQKLLNTEAGGDRYRVINAGRPGYTSYQGLVYLRDAIVQLRPHIVIIAFGFNDGLPTGDVEEDLERQRRSLSVVRADDFLLEHSQLWRWARGVTRGSDSPERPLRVPLDKFKRNLAEMIELAQHHGAKPLLLSFAARPFGEPSAYATAIEEVAADLRVPLVIYKGPRIDAVHPTAWGYTKLAAAIRDRLMQEGYVAGKREDEDRKGEDAGEER
jgi:lysophospholipase L1-like esterase